MANKNILLVEPGYKNKYPPLGLMKIAQYHGPLGKRDNVRFVKGIQPDTFQQQWDRVYVTTLFSFEFEKIAATIDFAIKAAHGQHNRVFVGGIAASLMTDRFEQEERWSGVRFIRGLLSTPPAHALQLDDFAGELYSDDTASTPIEDLIPDYDILDQIDYKYPVCDAYFVYGSRGCIRSCSFCGVPKLEGGLKDTESVTAIVRGIEKLYGAKKDLTFMDNNVVASPRFKLLIEEILELGFEKGAKLYRNGRPSRRRVDFNQGVDARILAKDKVYLRELARIAIRPLRIAFDHWGLRGPYELSIRYAHEFGLNDLSNYMLYNFHDSPADLFARMRLNVELNEELGIRIFSFPMRYQPTNLPHRSHVGEKWTKYQLRSLQTILKATHGIVSGEPPFFRAAFGDTTNAFEHLLLRPHHYIFNREYYEKYEGRPQFEDFSEKFARLSNAQSLELLDFLSSRDPSRYKPEVASLEDSQLRSIVTQHYAPPPKSFEQAIWNQRSIDQNSTLDNDEIVEDADLDDDTPEPQPMKRTA